ncbi:MAG: Fic family protein [Balneolaceae bacterium]|nr:Fic family protein [Balneolaceae bacterium]
MAWNWQHSDWPKFDYELNAYADYEKQFLQQDGIFVGSLKHLGEEEQELLRIELLSDEAYKTSEIEGELLRRDSLLSSIRKEFGLQADYQDVSPAEQGVSEMMVNLYRNFEAPLSRELLCRWHSMIMKGRKDLEKVGAYRIHTDPMQIVSGSMNRPKVHFEAPPSARVSEEMKWFIHWFNRTRPDGEHSLPALVRSGIAHLYFESIHPFEDGNGRIGRALSEMALAQHAGRPPLLALSATIEEKRTAYYGALQQASARMEISAWLSYFCRLVLDAQDRTQSTIDFLVEKGKFYRSYLDLLNERQAKVVNRMFREGISGFEGGLSADNYLSITGTSRATATRDLQDLVKMGAFRRTGERRYTRYYLNIDHPSAQS